MSYLVLDVGGSSIKHAIADESYVLTEKGSVPTGYDTHAEFIETIGTIYDRYSDQVTGIAMSSCGELDPVSGHMFSGGALLFNAGTNMIASVTARCGVPVSVENDANCALLAELHDGSLSDCTNGVALVMGTGVGGAVLINGRIYHGSHFHSGNASFFKPDLDRPDDPGFAWVNGVPALITDYAARAGLPAEAVDGRLVFERVASGEAEAVAALDAYCSRLATFIFNLQLILDVEAFAIGGGISIQPVFIETLDRHVGKVFDGVTRTELPRPSIRACRYFNDANLLGALYHHLNPSR